MKHTYSISDTAFYGKPDQDWFLWITDSNIFSFSVTLYKKLNNSKIQFLLCKLQVKIESRSDTDKWAIVRHWLTAVLIPEIGRMSDNL